MLDPKMTVAEAAMFLNISVQGIHKKIKSRNLVVQRKQNRFYFGHEIAKSLFNLKFPNRVITVQNIKGGVGKTELVFGLAVRASLYGAKVLCIDLDMQGNLTAGCFKINSKDKPIMIDVIKDNIPIEDTIVNIFPGLDLIPSDLDNGILDNTILLGRLPLDKVYKEKIDFLKKDYDLIFIDCPPALSPSVTAATLASNEVLAPINPDSHSISGLDLLKNELEKIQKTYQIHIILSVVFNKFDIRNNLSNEQLDKISKSDSYKDKLYNSYIRKVQEFPNAIDHGQTIFDNFKFNAAKEDIDSLVKEMLDIKATTEI